MSSMRRAAAVWLSSACLGSGCFQELDSNAANGPMPSTDAGLVTAIDDPSIALDPNDSATTNDPCVKTANDAHGILSTYCGGCHDQGAASSGVPRFDFLLDDQKLMSTIWTVGSEQRRFIIAGDPDHSWLYLRPLLGTMPPAATDLRNHDYPRPTVSDLSVLRTWIGSCIDPSATRSSTMTPPPTPQISPRPMSTDTAQYNFETSAQGWAGLAEATGQGAFAGVATSTAEHFAGASSLSARIDAPTGPCVYFLEVESPPVTAGAQITFHVLLPSGVPIGWVRPYVVDGSGAMTGTTSSTASAGAWSTLSVVVPQTRYTITRLGVELDTLGAGLGTLYLDSINWP
jgi:hypothetical protein